MQKHRRTATPAKPVFRPAPAPYTGSGTEVVDSLEPGTIPVERLLAVAAWHEARRGQRHADIAARLKEVAFLAANDNTAKQVAV